MPRYRIAVDTGGTFSDFVYLNEDTGAVAVGKSLDAGRPVARHPARR